MAEEDAAGCGRWAGVYPRGVGRVTGSCFPCSPMAPAGFRIPLGDRTPKRRGKGKGRRRSARRDLYGLRIQRWSPTVLKGPARPAACPSPLSRSLRAVRQHNEVGERVLTIAGATADPLQYCRFRSTPAVHSDPGCGEDAHGEPVQTALNASVRLRTLALPVCRAQCTTLRMVVHSSDASLARPRSHTDERSLEGRRRCPNCDRRCGRCYTKRPPATPARPFRLPTVAPRSKQ